VTCWFCTKIN